MTQKFMNPMTNIMTQFVMMKNTIGMSSNSSMLRLMMSFIPRSMLRYARIVVVIGINNDQCVTGRSLKNPIDNAITAISLSNAFIV